MINEREYVIQAFKENFKQYINEPLVIYGLGPNTKAVLEEAIEYNIVGLMDQARTGDIVFGKDVISFEEVLKRKTKAIIIIARASNVSIIYRRIAKLCSGNGILVYDINGNVLSVEMAAPVFNDERYKDINEELLYDMISKHDVISFDVFDTLLMRNVLYPRDIFVCLENLLCEKYKDGRFNGFANLRIKVEQELYYTTNPSIEQIYFEMNTVLKLSDEEISELIQMEISLENQHLIPREKMREIFNQTINRKKTVCITSDMYFSSEQIREYLINNGFLVEAVPIFVSNEYLVSKCNGLFEKVREAYQDKTILHIGDNDEADDYYAKYYGIDETFPVKSAYCMLEDSVINELLQYTDSIEDRKFIARLIGKQFNNPFAFEKTKGKLCIGSEYSIGHDFVAPFVVVFIKWILDNVSKWNIEKVLLASRDGFLVKELLDAISTKSGNLPEYLYFYASRSVCIKAGLLSEEDIKYVATLAFSGNIEELLVKRFGLQKNELLQRLENETDEEYILRHKDNIFAIAQDTRNRYLKYINSLPVDFNGKCGFFDFVSSGTCQRALSNFCNIDLVGLYFVRIYDEYKKDLEIIALCPEASVYQKQMAIMEKYFFLENIFSSYEATLIDFDMEGNPIFENETRTKEQFDSLTEIQNGIKDAVVEACDNNGKISFDNLYLADAMLKFISKQYAIIDVNYFDENPLIDEFCNRNFDTSNFIN